MMVHVHVDVSGSVEVLSVWEKKKMVLRLRDILVCTLLHRKTKSEALPREMVHFAKIMLKLESLNFKM